MTGNESAKTKYKVVFWVNADSTETHFELANSPKEAGRLAAEKSFRSDNVDFTVPDDMFFQIDKGSKTMYKNL